MSTFGRYQFLSWTRRGIEASLDQPDTGTLPARASLDVQLTVSYTDLLNLTATVKPSPVHVQLYGPGDVVGIDPRHIIRTEPKNFTVNFEPNYLCGIEFDAPDFPWLVTPAAPNGDRLQPWLVLIALIDSEFTVPSGAPNPLPIVQVTSNSGLPDLSDSWNWAHTQISGDSSLTDAITQAPGSVISRIICTRRLEPETSYHAFLVPAFDIGVQAGLGGDVSSVTTAEPAWTERTQLPFSLPYYYKFQFHTSDAGDFESLVRQLTPGVLPAGVGTRPIDVSQPAPSFPSGGLPLGLEGALHSTSSVATTWQNPAKTTFQDALETWINQPSLPNDDPASPNPNDPVIAPPIYGRWLAAIQSVAANVTGWVNGLNLDPRYRSGAGMGTTVVQDEATALMASAWQQVAGIIKANQVLKQAQLARASLQQVMNQRLSLANAPTIVTLTAPLHSKLLSSPTTILATVRASLVPERMLSPTFRRLTRPRRRLGTSPGSRPSLLSRVNSGELTFVPPIAPPNGLVSIEQVSSEVSPSGNQSVATKSVWILLAILIIAIILAVIVGVVIDWLWAAFIFIGGAILAYIYWTKAQTVIQNSTDAGDLTIAGMTPTTVANVPSLPGFQINPPGTLPTTGSLPGSGPDSAAASAFRTAAGNVFGYLQNLPTDTPAGPPLDLDGLQSTLIARLDPLTTVPSRIQSMISLSSRMNWKQPDPLEPIMAAPVFPQPMYIPLKDLSQQYLLPGVDLVPPNSLGLLIENRAFIESYMVGLNHEMGRLLLWNGYPTDQRGSCFRQFWDVSSYVRQPGDPTDSDALAEILKDIPPINTWPVTNSLGDNPERTNLVLNNVVLLVRGDLLKRYPNAVIYAAKAKLVNNQRVLDDTDERYPIYRGTLEDDMTFFGFNLSLDDARGGTAASQQGYFFVFQQQPSEPRFGLEPAEAANPTTHWADLAWTNFGVNKSNGSEAFTLPDLGNTARGALVKNSPWRLASQVFSFVLDSVSLPSFILSSPQPQRLSIADDATDPDDMNNSWGKTSAQTAYILLRMPFRILVHADLMLPAE
jgi:hypothetical protein